MTLRQMQRLEGEIKRLEEEIISRGHRLAGLKRLLQVQGMNLLSAIGLLVEIGDIAQFDSSKQLVS
jgi:transposase